MRIAIFGTGYVGLTQAACFAEVGHTVCCVDVDAQRVAALGAGEVPFYAPGLGELIRRNLAAERLLFTTSAALAIEFGAIVFIAVGTPTGADGSADLQQVFAVTDDIGRYAREAKIVVNKSTAPVGTAEAIEARISAALRQRGSRFDIEVVCNPEFLKEGSAVDDCMRPDRIIIGTENAALLETFEELYRPFSRNRGKLIVMDRRSAELTKYAANAMLATKISFINEMANLAEHFGADIEMVRRGIGSDSRIGYDFIYPGCGYGGSCFPKDIQALTAAAERTGYRPQLLGAVASVNSNQKKKLFDLICKHYSGALKNKIFALWGLSFKPNTDDMREAPSRVLLETLWQAGARVRAYDPCAMPEAARIYGERRDLILVASKEEALEQAHALVVVTEWQNFRVLDIALAKHRLRDRVIFDGRNLFEPSQLEAGGLTYYAIGRNARMPVRNESNAGGQRSPESIEGSGERDELRAFSFSIDSSEERSGESARVAG